MHTYAFSWSRLSEGRDRSFTPFRGRTLRCLEPDSPQPPSPGSGARRTEPPEPGSLGRTRTRSTRAPLPIFGTCAKTRARHAFAPTSISRSCGRTHSRHALASIPISRSCSRSRTRPTIAPTPIPGSGRETGGGRAQPGPPRHDRQRPHPRAHHLIPHSRHRPAPARDRQDLPNPARSA